MPARKIEIVDTGLVYQNPKPYLRAIHAMHPSLTVVSDREVIATFDLGQGPESLDYHTVLSRSMDAGKTWTLEGPLLPKPPAKTTHTIRTTLLADGSMLGFGALYHREDPEEGILNRKTLGLVPVDLLVTRSKDLGRTWSAPEMVKAPLNSPGWEASHCPLELAGGTIAVPIATWRGWDGSLPCGEQSIVMFSDDGGRTWPRYAPSFDGTKTGFIHWEQCVIAWQQGLLAFAWRYDPVKAETHPSVYAVAQGQPPAFAPAKPTGFLAQTGEIMALDSSHVLCVYRRLDKPGLWSNVARVEKGEWTNEEAVPLWQGGRSDLAGNNIANSLSSLKFGSPSMKQLRDGTVIVAFWCQEESIYGIRWIRLRLA